MADALATLPPCPICGTPFDPLTWTKRTRLTCSAECRRLRKLRIDADRIRCRRAEDAEYRTSLNAAARARGRQRTAEANAPQPLDGEWAGFAAALGVRVEVCDGVWYRLPSGGSWNPPTGSLRAGNLRWAGVTDPALVLYAWSMVPTRAAA